MTIREGLRRTTELSEGLSERLGRFVNIRDILRRCTKARAGLGMYTKTGEGLRRLVKDRVK